MCAIYFIKFMFFLVLFVFPVSVVQEIGRGSYGAVYEVMEVKTEKKRAMKVRHQINIIFL
jgi:hypothetical protein